MDLVTNNCKAIFCHEKYLERMNGDLNGTELEDCSQCESQFWAMIPGGFGL